MKGTVFAVALNHRSQLDAWQEAFSQPPYNAPPKTAVWFIKPRNTVIRHGEPIPYPQGEKVLSGATVALIVGKTASRIRPEAAADYIAGYALANEVSPAGRELLSPRRLKRNVAMAFARWVKWRR
ncbi:4-hydroxyphenylacetate degradation bifunctional isomerase/decarboxylase [Salmonella enterica subsp. enterica]|nr:4-hydroxyphenylacetate degradation bifunctional isomerase/decarboxylase [Salmonella enterica subsp. enterica]